MGDPPGRDTLGVQRYVFRARRQRGARIRLHQRQLVRGPSDCDSAGSGFRGSMPSGGQWYGHVLTYVAAPWRLRRDRHPGGNSDAADQAGEVGDAYGPRTTAPLRVRTQSSVAPAYRQLPSRLSRSRKGGPSVRRRIALGQEVRHSMRLGMRRASSQALLATALRWLVGIARSRSVPILAFVTAGAAVVFAVPAVATTDNEQTAAKVLAADSLQSTDRAAAPRRSTRCKPGFVPRRVQLKRRGGKAPRRCVRAPKPRPPIKGVNRAREGHPPWIGQLDPDRPGCTQGHPLLQPRVLRERALAQRRHR